MSYAASRRRDLFRLFLSVDLQATPERADSTSRTPEAGPCVRPPVFPPVPANRLALDLGVPSGRVTDILNGRRSISADTAVRLWRYFGNSGQFWLELQSQYDIAVVERDRGDEIA
ncbi:MAG: HigA family addiction module antitoxin, partial [Stellaceae bacterium]